jgi:predicted DNA-binding transcriptional regulator YafY
VPSRLHRLIRIIRIVKRKGFPGVQSLCLSLDIKERTLFNDLKELKDELGVNIQFDRIRGGYYLENDDIEELNFVTLSESNAVLLLTAIELLDIHAGRSAAEPLRELFDAELRQCLGDDNLNRTKEEVRAKLG